MSFSWEQHKKDALEIKIRRAKTRAKNQHPDWKLKYPGEARDAAQGNYTVLINRIKKEAEIREKTQKNRIDKRLGK